MSRAWKFQNPDGLYFISFATVGWIDVFTRRVYNEIVVDSLNYSIENKGLELCAWVLMTNHMHWIARAAEGFAMPDIIRDFKKYTSKQILKAIEENDQESRKEWMLSIFKNAGSYNSNNSTFQFWRQDNKPIELIKPGQIENTLKYLHNNPVVAGFVNEPEQYLHSSATDYGGDAGLVKIQLL